MELFLDTASMTAVKQLMRWGCFTGLTTNQSIFLKEKGCYFEERAQDLLGYMNPYPVSLEGPNDYEGIIQTAKQYRKWGRNVVIKVPMLPSGDGLTAVQYLRAHNIDSNVTACMSSIQALLAAQAGATYVSLFYNRIKDFAGVDHALDTIAVTMDVFKQGGYKTKLIVGSIRSSNDVKELLAVHPDICTITPKVLYTLPYHERTVSTLKDFEHDWEMFCNAEKK